MNRRLPSDQRALYRVRANSTEAQVFVGLPDGPVRAELRDLSARGCGFVLPTASAASLEQGGVVMLRMVVGGDDLPHLFVRAVVRSLGAADGGTRVGVEFDDLERLFQQIQPVQWRFFNRRQAFRVPPADERGRPLRGRFHIPGIEEPRSVPIHDLSCSGLATEVRPQDEAPFPKHLPLRVQFRLPNIAQEVDVRALFVHRTVVEGRVRTGFRFDPMRTEDLDHQSERILRYVLDRQRRLLADAW